MADDESLDVLAISGVAGYKGEKSSVALHTAKQYASKCPRQTLTKKIHKSILHV